MLGFGLAESHSARPAIAADLTTRKNCQADTFHHGARSIEGKFDAGWSFLRHDGTRFLRPGCPALHGRREGRGSRCGDPCRRRQFRVRRFGRKCGPAHYRLYLSSPTIPGERSDSVRDAWDFAERPGLSRPMGRRSGTFRRPSHRAGVLRRELSGDVCRREYVRRSGKALRSIQMDLLGDRASLRSRQNDDWRRQSDLLPVRPFGGRRSLSIGWSSSGPTRESNGPSRRMPGITRCRTMRSFLMA